VEGEDGEMELFDKLFSDTETTVVVIVVTAMMLGILLTL
jgi:hypothetical protein